MASMGKGAEGAEKRGGWVGEGGEEVVVVSSSSSSSSSSSRSK